MKDTVCCMKYEEHRLRLMKFKRRAFMGSQCVLMKILGITL